MYVSVYVYVYVYVYITRNASAGAPLGLSGVLATQAPEVVEAYAPFFTDVRVEAQDGDWVLITGVRNA